MVIPGLGGSFVGSGGAGRWRGNETTAGVFGEEWLGKLVLNGLEEIVIRPGPA